MGQRRFMVLPHQYLGGLMAKEKFARCTRCKTGKVMSDEGRRGFNAKSQDGSIICADCKVEEIYTKLRSK
jgi:hypothetical protein